MGKLKTSNEIIKIIANLRSKGYSISEISKYTGKSKSIVSKYIQGVSVLPQYISILKKKQGGSKSRSDNLWLTSNKKAQQIIKKLTSRDKLILLIGTYWGEGTKRELNIINSDPILLKAFIDFSKEIGVSKSRIKASVRVYNDIDQKKAINYWSDILGLDKKQFFKVEVIDGRKKGKLEFGMCRLRVEKSSKEFKLLMSLINVVKNYIMPA
jgi:transcriptional regulator with XRE-family HTH domain